MTYAMAARVWDVFAHAPEKYPDVAWRMWCDDYAITVVAYRARHKIGFAFSYLQLTDFIAPDEWLAREFERMVHELDHAGRS